MDRNEKEQLVASMRQGLTEANLVIVAQQTGLTVAEVSDLRRQMRDAGAHYKVAKNTLIRLSVTGTPSESLYDMLKGPTALAYSKDPVAAAKVTTTFANTNEKLKIMGGVLDGKLLTPKEIDALAKLPSLDVLRAKIIGVFLAPATRIASVLKAPAGQVARVISAYGQKG